MPVFRYSAKTPYATQTGEIESESLFDAKVRLRELGLEPMQVHEVKDHTVDPRLVTPRAAYIWDCPECKEKNVFIPPTPQVTLQATTPEQDAEITEATGLEAINFDDDPEAKTFLETLKENLRFVNLPDEVTCSHCLTIFNTQKKA